MSQRGGTCHIVLWEVKRFHFAEATRHRLLVEYAHTAKRFRWVPFHVFWNMVEHLFSHHEGSKQACRHGAFHVLCATEVNTKIITM